jgi:hypothetical protein
MCYYITWYLTVTCRVPPPARVADEAHPKLIGEFNEASAPDIVNI